MLGAVIGDIAGSRFEWHNCKSKEFDLFAEGCRPTDDTNMTLAVAKAILLADGDRARLPELAVESMREFGRKYPHGYRETSHGAILYLTRDNLNRIIQNAEEIIDGLPENIRDAVRKGI